MIERIAQIKDVASLEQFVQNEYDNIYHYFIFQSYKDIQSNKKEIEYLLSNSYALIRELDLSNTINKNFLTVVILATERIGAFSLFERYYGLIKDANDIPLRLQAVSKYRIGIKRFDDYERIFDDFLSTLSLAYELEEDNIEVVLAVFIEYYARVIKNFGQFNQAAILNFKRKIENTDTYLLKLPIIQEVLEVDIQDFRQAYEQIQVILDELLNRVYHIPSLKETCFLIEDPESIYVKKLTLAQRDFNSIRRISTNIWKTINDSNIYHSLGRGVCVLTEENQLYAYFNSYGPVHYTKMVSALGTIDFSSLTKDIEVIDWGCGQGLASITLLEQYPKLPIYSVTLIEPSEIALKRASLHVKHMKNSLEIRTVCKPFDSLTCDDIATDLGKIKIHLFSNILDVELFSLTNLQNLISRTQKGLNYFICASPYINELKTERIGLFRKYFERNYNSFSPIGIDYTTSKNGNEYWNCNKNFRGEKCPDHPQCGCDNKWTRVIRVFKVNFN